MTDQTVAPEPAAAKRRQRSPTARETGSPATRHPFNEVHLVGRLAAPVEERELPSGDLLSTFRLVVPRTEAERAASRRPESRGVAVDTIDCVAWRAGLRRTVNAWHEGDTVAVTGALRRRFWRGSAGAASRHEIEVSQASRLRRASP
jgi:single-strand DNA-binding protein